MKAAICKEFGKPLEMAEVNLRSTAAGEIRVKMKAVAICHSDIAYMDGIWGGDLPAVYGHEAAGEILEIGEGISGYSVGDAVLVTLIRGCGACKYCGDGHPTSCSEVPNTFQESPLTDASGAQITQGMSTAAFAEEVLVDQSQVHALPDDMAMDVASLLACGVITGYGAVTNSAQMKPGAHVIVIGAGGVGLNAVQGAAINGAATVTAIDVSEDKLSTAQEFGATHGVLAGELKRKKILEITEGHGADFVFVTVGAIPAFNQAPSLLATKGEIVLVGMPAVGAVAEYIPVNFAAMSQVIRGSKMGETVLTRDIPKLIGEYQSGQLKLDELISHRFAFDDINDAIAKTREGTSNRNILIFDK